MLIAQRMGISNFQLLIDHKKIDLAQEISDSESKNLLDSIGELLFASNLLRYRADQLVAIFEQDQFYLSAQYMDSFFDAYPG